MKFLHVGNAPKQVVWENVINENTYKKWFSDDFSDNTYNIECKARKTVKFLSPGKGGTMAKVVKCSPCDFILLLHVAIINPDGSEDSISKNAKDWMGTTESYIFIEKNGMTEILAEINASPNWIKALSENRTKALNRLKGFCEVKLVK